MGHIINTLLYIFIGTVHIVIDMDKHNNKYAHNNKYILITEMSAGHKLCPSQSGMPTKPTPVLPSNGGGEY